jgi:hypothetical protein
MDDAWATIGEITSRLDASSALPPETEKLLRIMKLTEEAGEVTQAVIGVMGQNPRKGITHTSLAWPRARSANRTARRPPASAGKRVPRRGFPPT